MKNWKTLHRSIFLTKRDVAFALSSDDEEATLRPLIKTEATDNDQGQQTATQTVAYTATETSEFQKKYTRLAWYGNIWADADNTEQGKDDSLSSSIPESTEPQDRAEKSPKNYQPPLPFILFDSGG